MHSAVLCAPGLLLLYPLATTSQEMRPATHPVALYRDANAPIEQRVRDLLRRMTVEEKVRQLDMYAGAQGLMDKQEPGKDSNHATADAVLIPDKAAALLGTLGVGSIHDLYPTPEQANAVQRWVIAHNRLGIPAMFIEEGLLGFDTGTVFPAPISLSATFNPKLARQTGAVIAAEARATGVDMVLGPVLDLAREPRWGRVEEDFGEDPYLTGLLGLEYVKGAQGDSLQSDHSVVAEPKHFAGHGSPESGVNMAPVHIGERELRTVMLKSFEPAIRDGHAMSVMAAYHEIDGIPVTADPYLLKTILRKEWGFNGFVLSDLGAIEKLYSMHHVATTPSDAACMAIRSGVDMQFYDLPHDVFQRALIDCLHNGSLSQADLDRAVHSVLRVKFALGLFEHPFIDPSLNATEHRSPAHLAVSLESARESMTLLKNEDHLLPLSTSTKHIAVIGPIADVARYANYESEANGKRISMLQGIRALVPRADVSFAPGTNLPSAIELAQSADVVIMGLGPSARDSGEFHDHALLDLPGYQQQLLQAIVATGKPVVLVLENGAPMTIGWAKEHVPAILEAWLPGEFGGTAIAETLFGLNNPAGRLTVSFPRSLGQLPDFYNSDPSKRQKYVDNDGKPLFPFGFGLSYTTFRYDHLIAEASAPGSREGGLNVTVDVTNTGTREGDEVAQLYVREDVTSVETPRRSLKGFSRIHLLPGQERALRFHVPQNQLTVWNASKQWVFEPGLFAVWIGGASDASLATTTFIRSGQASRVTHTSNTK